MITIFSWTIYCYALLYYKKDRERCRYRTVWHKDSTKDNNYRNGSTFHQTSGIWIVQRKPNSTLFSGLVTCMYTVAGYCKRSTTGKVGDPIYNLRTAKTFEAYTSLFLPRFIEFYLRLSIRNGQWFDIE
jgi:hypothetical protein